MIRKIVKLMNVGLFKDATINSAIDFGKVTLIYGENGRGKSTLSAIMRACSQVDSGRVLARKTIDSQDAPEIAILIQSGTQSSIAKFDNGNWSGHAPSILIFDSEFVDQNVYSGFVVSPGQRQSLLDFALGDQIVPLKQKVDGLTQKIDQQTTLKSQAERTLTVFASPYSVANYVKLQPVQDIRQQIATIQKRIAATKNAQNLLARKDPTRLPPISIDIEQILEVLQKQLPNIERAAEEMVHSHLRKHNQTGLEDWISQGQLYAGLGQCPFCDRPLAGVNLIRMYRSYFNQAYIDLKEEVKSAQGGIESGLSDSVVDILSNKVATNTARIEAWTDQFDVSAPAFPATKVLQVIRQARRKLMVLVSAKLQSPLEAVASQTDIASVKDMMATTSRAVDDYNSATRLVFQRIAAFKKDLKAEDLAALQAQLKRLEATQKRQLPQVITAVSSYNAASAERKRLEDEKAATRVQVDDLMKATLARYQTFINKLLESFGAEFRIAQLKPSYVGSGEPRTEYGLMIRNQQVKLGSREDLAIDHSFGTTLSEADKRTLAFAFFIARLRDEPNLADRIVLLDDPVSSLDQNRRRESIRVIAELAPKCQQLIVLSHDPHFLRDLKERFDNTKPTPTPTLLTAVKRVADGYSAFDSIDIEEVCSSDYYHHYHLVTKFVEGRYSGDTHSVAKALRPLLEGYYHRRFPSRIPRRLMFGQIITMAQQATPPDPLSYLAPILGELAEINDYAGRFHHDASESESIQIVDAELLSFARRTLNVIHQNG